MLQLTSNAGSQGRLKVLCVGAHCDDIEIGCGATLLQLQKQRAARIQWVVLTGDAVRKRETERAMRKFVKPEARAEIVFGGFPDGRLPAHYDSLKEFFERLKKLPKPDVILCHEVLDRHQDHRMVNELVWSTFRDHLIFEYEIPKWDGGITQPNVYVPISAAQLRQKIAALMTAYASQSQRDWFTPDTITAMARLRGIECRAKSGFAEAFHGRKISLAGL